ncbi:hypothetical protein P7B02_03500 [Caulobacter segnis]|uniref:hypothetical protein n=1 Tax=Caulobacter segnis TaxID=88688 RepID=UPI00240F3686|nr:hypothetical protein [Caulobacter segnis]MDG2520597.1 hypothetical protein [Caulobacter segnis]
MRMALAGLGLPSLDQLIQGVGLWGPLMTTAPRLLGLLALLWTGVLAAVLIVSTAISRRPRR